MSETFIFHGNPGVGPDCEGKAVISKEGFSARYDYDRYRGVISRESHELHGVFP